MSQFNHNFITTIIDRYGLELDDNRIDNLVVSWLGKYDSTWIVKAVVESLHRRTYKVKSVDSILRSWHRNGKPCCNFTAEFEREILQNLPEMPDLAENFGTETLSISIPEPEFLAPPVGLNFADLNPEESAPFSHYHHRPTPVHSSIEHHKPILAQKQPRNSGTTQPRFLAIFQAKNFATNQHRDQVKSDRTVYQPAKFQLYNTLKAIVAPNKSRSLQSDPIDSEPLRTADFELSIGNASGE